MKITNVYLQKIVSKKNQEWVGYLLCIEFDKEGNKYLFRSGTITEEQSYILRNMIGVSVHE